MTSSDVPYEDLQEYFPELENPAYEETLRTFFTDVSLDGAYCLLKEPEDTLPTSKDSYTKRLQSSAKFINELLSAFGISAVCTICPRQGRAGYVHHVCGANHFKLLQEKLTTDKKTYGSELGEIRKQYWQSWTFVLGKVDINYLTGELKVKRKKCFLGLQVQRAEQLPTTGRVGPKSHSSHRGHRIRILLGGFKFQCVSLDDVWIMLF